MLTHWALLVLGGSSASLLGHPHPDHASLRRGPQRTTLHRDGKKLEVQGGIDFSQAELDPDTGKMCVLETVEVETLVKEPILTCTHKSVEQCHYTYITQFKPTQEQVCTENFQKRCQISFKDQAFNETVRKCYKPVEKVCNGQGEEECRTIYESSCTTRYKEKSPGKFVGDSNCEKLPVEVCGKGCVYEEGPEECHDKVVASVVSMPEEVCDLNPQKICRFKTTLVPSLMPQEECTQVPKETCHLSFTNPEPGTKPLLTKWCLDESDPVVVMDNNGIEADVSSQARSTASSVRDQQTGESEDYDSGMALDLPEELGLPELPAPIESQSFYVSGELEAVDQFYGAPREARRAGHRSSSQGARRRGGWRSRV